MRLLTLIFILSPIFLFSQNVSIGDSPPNANAKLDIQSTTGGVLIPRLTTGERDLIPDPKANGLLIFNASNNRFEFWNGSVWGPISSAASEISDSNNDTKVETEQINNEDIIRFSAGGTELGQFKANRLEVTSPGNSMIIGKDAGISDNGSTNFATYLGYQAGKDAVDGFANTYVGANAGSLNSNGMENTILGVSAGYDSEGSNNTFIGRDAGRISGSGISNTFIGHSTGINSFGNRNVYIGASTGTNTAGNNNIGLGIGTLSSQLSGSFNIALGGSAGGNTRLGSNSIFIGNEAGSEEDGSNNIFIGAQSGFNNGGQDNVFLGSQAGENASGSGNVFLGKQAGRNEDGSDKLYIANNATNPLLFGDFSSSQLFLNRSSEITSAEVFGLRANTGSFGGMYIETSGLTGKPFYGFAINGLSKSWIYHDGGTNQLRFHIDGNRLSIKSDGQLRINNTYELPGEDGLNGQVLITDGSGNLNWGSKAAPLLEDNDSDTRITVEEIADEDKIRFMTGNVTSLIVDSLHMELLHHDSSLFIGLNAGKNNNQNISISELDGRYNSFIGLNAGMENKIDPSWCTGFNIIEPLLLGGCASHNTFLGANSGKNNTLGRNNLFIGSHSGFSQNTNVGSYVEQGYGIGSDNVYMGFVSGYSNKAGYRNTFIGSYAGQFNGMNQDNSDNQIGGYDNTYIGGRAGMFNENGKENVYVGTLAGGHFDNDEGDNNTFLGFEAGLRSQGDNNVYLGSQAGSGGGISSFSQNNNVYLGTNIGTLLNGNFSNNTIIGFEAGKTVDGSNNIAIGRQAATDGFGGDDRLVIGSTAGGKLPIIYGELQSNKVAINWDYSSTAIPQALSVNGNASKTTAGDWLANSDRRLKKNIAPLDSKEMLAKLLEMKGVSYEWRDSITGFDRPEGIQHGFIAQDIEKVWPENIESDDKGYLMTSYGTYDHMYVEAIKALNEKVNKLEAQNRELMTLVMEIKGREERSETMKKP